MQLADLQRAIASALVNERVPECEGLLVGGLDPGRRFAIHSRHYRASLARSIVERFPATTWLAGSDLVGRAALAFVQAQPPTRPCIAEYGDGFPAFLGRSSGASHLPYLEQFATIDWHLGRLAIQVDAPPTVLQIDWSLDELISFFLAGEAPDHYALRAETVWVQLTGARGELSLRRIAVPDREA